MTCKCGHELKEHNAGFGCVSRHTDNGKVDDCWKYEETEVDDKCRD